MMDEKASISSTATNSPYNTPSLFDQKPEKTNVEPDNPRNRKEIPSEPPVSDAKSPIVQEIKYIERPPRKITEIRIFFDDNTYEIFRGEK